MKPRPDKYIEWDIRATPVNQEDVPTEAWARLTTDEPDERLLVCREGGTTECKLHYHIFFKTRMSKTHLYNNLKLITGGSGNVAYKCSKAHDKSIGYIVKNKDVVYRHNYLDTHIDEYFRVSDEYRRSVEAERKRKTRTKQSTLKDICDKIRTDYPDQTIDGGLSAPEVFGLIYREYLKRDMFLPSRGILETAIVNLMPVWKIREYYLKNIT